MLFSATASPIQIIVKGKAPEGAERLAITYTKKTSVHSQGTQTTPNDKVTVYTYFDQTKAGRIPGHQLELKANNIAHLSLIYILGKFCQGTGTKAVVDQVPCTAQKNIDIADGKTATITLADDVKNDSVCESF